MVNQIYKENEMEEKIEKKMQVVSGGNAESNGIYFSKFFGVNAFEKMVELINLKAKHQKVLIIESESSYINFSFENKGIEFEPVRIAVDNFDKQMVLELGKTIDESIRFCVGFGGDFEIGVAKCLAKANNLQLIGFINQFCSLDAFLPMSELCENGVLKSVRTCGVDFLFIDSEEISNSLDRNKIVDAVFNIVAKLGAVAELYINCCLCKDNGYAEFEKRVVGVYDKLNKILDNAIDLSKNDALSIMDLSLEIADLMDRSNIELVDKEGLFSSIYKYLDKKSRLSINALKAVATQVYIKLYKDFLLNLNYIGNSYFDIDKRANLFDLTFRNASLEFVLDEPVTDREMYLLKRFNDKILNKIEVVNALVDKLMFKALDLFNDSGYTFLNGVNKEAVMQSVYFSADVVEQKCLLKIMRNLGVLDFYN